MEIRFPQHAKVLLTLYQLGRDLTVDEIDREAHGFTGEAFDCRPGLQRLHREKLAEHIRIPGAGRLAKGNRDPKFRLTERGTSLAEDLIDRYSLLFR